MAKTLALVFGIVFVIIGLLGFVPNPLVGMTGIFMTDMLHNLVHLVFGIILVATAVKAPGKSGLWLKILGVVYLLLAVLGFVLVPDGGMLLGLVMTNMNDHWLHVVLGVVLVIAGFTGGKGMASAAPSMPSSMPPGPPTA